MCYPASHHPRIIRFWAQKNCIVTPHIAWATKEARTRLIESAATNLRAFSRWSSRQRRELAPVGKSIAAGADIDEQETTH
jgi:phosphoglycerate dehydrogenase-like enzyme